MKLGDRLRAARQHLSLTQREMAEKLGEKYGTYQAWEQNRTETPGHVFITLTELGFHADWLLRGDASDNAPTSPANLGLAEEGREFETERVLIPLYESPRASLGGGAIIEAESSRQVVFDRRMLQDLGGVHSTRELAMMAADGESMEPTIRSGETVLFDMSDAARRARDGIFVIRLENAIMIKRLQPLPGRTLRVINDNDAFEPFEVRPDAGTDFAIIGRVTVVFRRL